MADNKYRLRYLPLFYKDFSSIVNYITNVLVNPKAAENLIGAVESAIMERIPNAESFEKYASKKERKYTYYRIYVGNYIIYYVVIDDNADDKIMEVRRILYKGRDGEKLI